MKKLTVSLVILILLLTAAWNQTVFPAAKTASAQEAIEKEAGPGSETMRVLREEMTLVWLQSEDYAFARTACAGSGLDNVTPLSTGSMVLIPNAGDLSVEGSNVSIKLNSDGAITFIPRTQGQQIRVPMDLGAKVAGQEVLSLTLNEAEQLAAAGKLIWTAREQGPFGNGHGLPGHIAACDPQYRDDRLNSASDGNSEDDDDDDDDNDD